MAKSTAAMILLAFAMLQCSCMAATLNADKESMMRREAHLQINPTGEMLEAAFPREMVEQGLAELTDDQRDDMSTEYCDYDFPTGLEGTNNCSLPGEGHRLIKKPITCMEAAARSGATTVRGKFMISPDWADAHPKGCFKDHCSEATNGICYFFNDIGDWPEGKGTPATITGFPICRRPKLLNGTEDTNGGCDNGYSVIDHEDTCRQAAGCWFIAQGTNFLIGEKNASKHLDYPRGCFINMERKEVFYNPESLMGTGTRVKGMPICNVSVVTTWSSDAFTGTVSDTASHTHTHALDPSVTPADATGE